jgi:hypothetical protein
MSFLNPKEDVIDIQLTPFGRFLYSQGKLKPVYYAFFDDDVIYDSQYASFNESQNSIEPRIQEETPQLMCIGNNSCVETSLSIPYSVNNSNNSSQLFSLTKVIGTSDLDYNYGASWDIKFIKGNLTSFASNLTSSSGKIVSIQQLETSVVYDTSIITDEIAYTGFQDTDINSYVQNKRDNYNFNDFEMSDPFGDGTRILSEEKSLLLDISEKNTQLINDMFDVEVFRYDKDSSGNDLLTKLFFRHKMPEVVNDILLDEQEQPSIEITNEFVEYYFNVFVDNEINNQTICDFIKPTQQGKNTMVNIVGCDETVSEPTTSNLYSTNAKPGDSC